MTQNNQELPPFNPFNPIKTYRLYSSRSQTTHQTNKSNSVQLAQQSNVACNPYNQMGIHNYALFIRNSENKGLKSDQNFQTYIKRLEDNRKQSKNIIRQTKKQQKHELIQIQQFEDDVKKSSYGSQIKNTTKDQRKEKFQHQITEMIAEIKSPFYKKGRYLLNEDKDKEKKLAKPLFCGIQSQIKQQQKRKLDFSQIDINKLRYKIFFDDYNPLQQIVTSQQSAQKEETINESPLKTDQQFFIEQ